ncbi:putative heat shock protein 70 family protein [Tanacetum coccineum]
MNENGRPSKEEIEKRTRDVEKYKLEDQEYKNKVHAHNALEDYLYEVGNKMNEFNIKKRVHPESLKKIENAIAETTDWHHDNGTTSAEEHLSKKAHLEFVPELMQLYGDRNNNHLSVLKFHESMLLRCFLITSLRSVAMLVDSNRIPEVALMAQSYLPSKVLSDEADLDELTRSHKESYNCNDVYELLGNSACWTYLLNTILQMDLRWQNTVATIAYLLTKKGD